VAGTSYVLRFNFSPALRSGRAKKIYIKNEHQAGDHQFRSGCPRRHHYAGERGAVLAGLRAKCIFAHQTFIAGVPPIEGFEEWKQSYALLHAQANEQMQPFYGKLPLYKAVYDFFQEMVHLTRHFPKDLHYTLGDKIVDHVLEINTCLYRTLHLPKGADGYAGAKSRSIERIGELLNTVRFLLRTSFDMKLYNVERFAGVSAKIDGIGKQLTGWKKSQ
jgi:hypothetical protein